MVTANRKALARRAVHCFTRQSYANRELVVIDDGEEDLSELLEAIPPDRLIYRRIPRAAENVLGRLRNVALDTARGALMAQWDDDDWYHPDRLIHQVAAILGGADACCLAGTLMHLDDPAWFHRPYVGLLKDGVPGSIVHRRDPAIRYPEQRRAEDSRFLDAWLERPYAQLSRDHAHLFIRCFHGANTWEQRHFLTRMRNTPRDSIEYVLRRATGTLDRHSRFRLSEAERAAFGLYLNESRALGLL
jgi:glycosyltransferase involved in cell wall biosynthesis